MDGNNNKKTELKNKRKRPLSYELLYAFAHHEIEIDDMIL